MKLYINKFFYNNIIQYNLDLSPYTVAINNFA